MKSLLGKKIGMSRIFTEEGKALPVTLISVGPCVVTNVKTKERDGYQAVQIGYQKKKDADKKSVNAKDYKFVQELRNHSNEDVKVADELTIDLFKEGEKIDIIGTSKGKGFTGVVKRHGFAGSPKTHGHRHDLRSPGSIGSAFPQHVIKGKKMAGREGNKRVTVKNLEILHIDTENSYIAVKGSVPGSRNTYIQVVGKE